MNRDYAKAQVRGEIAFDPKLTKGGAYYMKVLVKREGREGKTFNNWITIVWFGEAAARAVASLKKGARVSVSADINTQKPQGEDFYREQIVGLSFKRDDEQSEGVSEDYPEVGDDGIPF